jgi:hypothetical protein
MKSLFKKKKIFQKIKRFYQKSPKIQVLNIEKVYHGQIKLSMNEIFRTINSAGQ